MYISTARNAVTRAELGQILRVSRQNNAAAGVSGLLVAGGKRFLQALEGEGEAVESTFERIRGDVRHVGVVLLARQVVDERAFGVWAMGCQVVAAPKNSSGVSTSITYLIDHIADVRTRSEFRQFAVQQAS